MTAVEHTTAVVKRIDTGFMFAEGDGVIWLTLENHRRRRRRRLIAEDPIADANLPPSIDGI